MEKYIFLLNSTLTLIGSALVKVDFAHFESNIAIKCTNPVFKMPIWKISLVLGKKPCISEPFQGSTPQKPLL
jgi:hypothetical protein